MANMTTSGMMNRDFTLIDLTGKRHRMSDIRAKKVFAKYNKMVDVEIEFTGNMGHRGKQLFKMYFTEETHPCWEKWGGKLNFPLENVATLRFVSRNGEILETMMTIMFILKDGEEIMRGFLSDKEKEIIIQPVGSKCIVATYNEALDLFEEKTYLIEDECFRDCRDPVLIPDLRIKFADFRYATFI